MQPKKPGVLAVALPLFALGLLAIPTGCKKAEEPADAAVSVQAEKAEKKDLTQYVSGDAILSPLAQSALVPKISAPVKRFLVQRGAHVKQGQLLAELENRDLAASLTDSKGSLTQAQAAYDTSIQAQIPEDQQKAQLDVDQTQAQMNVAKNVMDARKNLADQGAIPRRDYETAAASYVQARAAFDIATHHLASLKAVSEKASIESAQGALASAKGKYQAAEAGLSYSEIRSPIDGVVTDRPLFAGEMAQAGQPILTVMDTSSLIAKVHLAQAQAQSLKLGAPAVVTIAGVDDPLKGVVSLISPALDAGSTTLEVWVKLPNKKGELKAGTPAHVQIAVQTIADALCVPNEAIVPTKEGASAVMVIGADGVAKSKTVKTGITDGQDTQITGGLEEGEQVVTKGAYGMDDGTKVKVVAAGADDDDEKPAAGTPAKGDDK
jgi:multidrug efflux pump subunit AcrA (membrane-fusion protein)